MPTTKTLNQSPTIGATENADLLWIWDNSAAELDKISLGNLFAANQTFALLNGRGGGQTLIGGTAANDDLTLEGTSNATRTTSYVILQPNDGNVGIGTTAPSYRAEVAGTIFGSWNGTAFSATPLALAISNTQPGGYDPVLMFQQTDSGGTTKNAGGIGVVSASNWAAGNNANQISDMYFLVRNNSGGISERMRITDNGNVGIGTTAPSYRAEVAGAIFGSWNGTAFSATPLALAISNTQPGGYDPVLMFQQTDAGGTTKNAGGIGVVGASNWAAGNNANQISDMYFLVRNNSGGISERMRITNNGNVGIGTTSPSTRLDIDAGAIEFAEMTAPAAGAVNTGRLFCRDNGTGQTQLCIIFSSGAIQVIATQP